jgi:pyrroline-5-carboxylate reductase
MKKKIGIIGYGNMGQAIAEQLKSSYEIFVFDKDKSKISRLSGINVTQNAEDLINKSDIIILAIKPQDFDNLLNEIRDYIANKLVISIAAGIKTKDIERKLNKAKVIRVMPNIAVIIGEGVTCLAKGRHATDDDLNFAKDLFSYMGKTGIIAESKMEMVTAASGSGPAFCFEFGRIKNIDSNNKDEIIKFVQNEFVPRLNKILKDDGFSAEEAEFLSASTGNSCISLVVKTKIPTADLIKQITSKGGTTQAGLEELARSGSLEEAIKAAKNRAQKLSKKGEK